MVRPTIWGMIVEARDQVRSTVRAPERWTASTRCSSFSSMKGPFFVDLDNSRFPSSYLSYRRRTMSLSLGFVPRVL